MYTISYDNHFSIFQLRNSHRFKVFYSLISVNLMLFLFLCRSWWSLGLLAGDAAWRNHQGAGLASAADAGWLHLCGGARWQNHVHLGDGIGASGPESGETFERFWVCLIYAHKFWQGFPLHSGPLALASQAGAGWQAAAVEMAQVGEPSRNLHALIGTCSDLTAVGIHYSLSFSLPLRSSWRAIPYSSIFTVTIRTRWMPFCRCTRTCISIR